MRLWKKTFVLVLVGVLLLTPLSIAGIWQDLSIAGEFEVQGDFVQALPYWISAVEYFEAQPKNEGVYINIALFAKKIGKYYDSIKQYEKAVLYYEKENENWNLAGKPWGAEDMLRVEEIRTFFEYYVEVAADEDQVLAKYEPISGIYKGIYAENDPMIGQDFSKTNSVYGSHAMYILYQDWNQTFRDYYGKKHPLDITLAEDMKDLGASFHVAMNAMRGLEVVEKSEWLIEWAMEANKLDMPIYLRLFGEMNGDWIPWSGNPDLYKEKFRMVHDVMEKYAPNVVMVWCPGDAPVENSEGIRIEDYYPGDDYVDWVGVNFYVDYYNSGNINNPNNHLQNPLAHLDYIYDLYADRKPIMVGESGISHYDIPSSTDLSDWAIANMKKFYTQLPIKYPRVKAVNYFSVDQAAPHNINGSQWSNYLLSDKNIIQSTYKELMSSDYYLGDMTSEHNMTFEEIETYDFKGQDEIYFVIKIPDYKIDKVEFLAEGTLIGTDRELPFSLKSDYSMVDTLTLKVYNSEGNLSTIRIIDLNAIPQEPTPLSSVFYHEAYVEGHDGMVRPDEAVTREEVAAMIARLMLVPDEELAYINYDDVNQNIWAYPYVRTVVSERVLLGYGEQFKPDQLITKAEFAMTLFNFANHKDIELSKVYGGELSNVEDNHQVAIAIRTMIEYTMNGQVSEDFDPESTLTRGDAIMMINALTGRTILESPEATFKDLGKSHEAFKDIESATQRHMKK